MPTDTVKDMRPIGTFTKKTLQTGEDSLKITVDRKTAKR